MNLYHQLGGGVNNEELEEVRKIAKEALLISDRLDGHDYTAQVRNDDTLVRLDCVDGNTYHYSCSRCGGLSEETFCDSDTAIGSHTYSSSYEGNIIVQYRTCTLPEIKRYVCTVCGNQTAGSTYRSQSAKGHNFISRYSHRPETLKCETDEYYEYYYCCISCGTMSTSLTYKIYK